MTYFAELCMGKFYVVGLDRHGNTYDTMRHFDTRELAKIQELIDLN